MVISQSFWKNKKVLVTGHTGFKGGWLSLWLKKMQAQVVGYSLPPPTQPSLFESIQLDSQIEDIRGDVRDFENLKKVILEQQPEIIFHLAAQPLVRYSYQNTLETYSTNVMGSVHLLESLRFSKSVKAVVMVTSDKCYENKEWEWGYREDEPMGGFDPYSNSKGCAELVTSAFRNSFFNPQDYSKHGIAIASARAGNVIGGGDWSQDRLIPDIIQSFIKQENVIIRNPQSTRPWQHVLVPLSGYLLLAQNLWTQGPRFSEAWNFGPKEEDTKPVSWIVDQVAKLWGKNATWKQDAHLNPHEAHYLKLDSSKANSKLGWQAQWNIDKALENTVTWYQAFLSQQNMKEYTLAQIDQFISSEKI